MRAITLGLAALLTSVSALPADAEAQRRGSSEARLEEIEEQLRDLQGVVFGADQDGAPVRFQGANPEGAGSFPASDPQANAETLVRIGALEREIQQLTGQVEQNAYQLRQQQEQMRELYRVAYPEYEGRVGLSLGEQTDTVRGGGSLDPVTGGPVDLVGGGGARDGLPSYADADAAFAAGRSALLEARYADAERAFLSLTEQFPNSERAGDAVYYLGETYLAQGDLGAAARTFLDFVRNYPDNPRAAEAHLKLGQAFARADKVSEACRVWARGLQTYRNMDQSLRRRMQDMRDATCPS